MNFELLQWLFFNVIAPIGTFLGGALTFVLKNRITQKKVNQEAELVARKSELENVEKAIKIWSDISERLESKLNDRDSEIQSLKEQLNDISRQYKSLLDKLTQIEKDYSLLEKNYKELKKELSK